MAKKLTAIATGRPAILDHSNPLRPVWLIPTFVVPPTDPISVRIREVDEAWEGRRKKESAAAPLSRWRYTLWRIATETEAQALERGEKIVIEGGKLTQYPAKPAETKPAETKPAEAKPVEAKPVDTLTPESSKKTESQNGSGSHSFPSVMGGASAV